MMAKYGAAAEVIKNVEEMPALSLRYSYMRNVNKLRRVIGLPRLMTWTGLLMSIVVNHTGEAAGTSDGRPLVERDYAKLMAACGRESAPAVSFFSALGGLWPVPSNFVLVDAANNRLEYNDLAFPWDSVRKTSSIFFGGRESLERRWPDLFSRQDGTTTQKCSLQVTRYSHWENFDAPVVVISNVREYLLLVGPISGAATAALDCYASTARLRGVVCN